MASPSVSSSSTLWAVASREWVIQPKPKPGRKPKKESAPNNNREQADNKGRRDQNRAAQRAFRERKHSQLAELQARVQSYEQGEIERSVSLQNAARKLKEENEVLRRENLLLKEKLSRMDLERDRDASLGNDKKRCRNDPPSSSDISTHLLRKKSKVVPEAPSSPVLDRSTSRMCMPHLTTPSPNSKGLSEIQSSPLLFLETDRAQHSSFSNLLEFPSNAKAGSFGCNAVFPVFNCGFCSDNTPCVCREIASQPSMEQSDVKNLKNFDQSRDNSVIMLDHPTHLQTAAETTEASILDCLPAYQPSIPLRRRTVNTSMNPIFQITPQAEPLPASSVQCSGDPTNCMACADDSFGRAFCAAIGESVATAAPCIHCPNSQVSTGDDGSTPEHPADRCCGDPTECDRRRSSSSPTSSVYMPQLMQSHPKMIPTNDAWRQLKSHPNIEFKDLSLLADVVARGSNCTGPVVASSPVSDSILFDQADSLSNHCGVSRMTDCDADYHGTERRLSRDLSTSPRLVPQEELVKCGRRWRVREVDAYAVRDALRLLDSKFSHS